MRRTRRDWDLLELPWVDVLSSDRGRTSHALENARLAAQVELWQTSTLIDLAACGSWETYWASRTSRWRNNVRRSEKKLALLGKVHHIRYRPEGIARGDALPRWDWYDAC